MPSAGPTGLPGYIGLGSAPGAEYSKWELGWNFAASHARVNAAAPQRELESAEFQDGVLAYLREYLRSALQDSRYHPTGTSSLADQTALGDG